MKQQNKKIWFYRKLTIQAEIFMVHVMFFIEARPFLPHCPHFLTNVGDDLDG